MGGGSEVGSRSELPPLAHRVLRPPICCGHATRKRGCTLCLAKTLRVRRINDLERTCQALFAMIP